ncbi:MAG: hypothetical protein AB1633_10110, partial [Elusimicrobiota bacterium]
MKTPILSLIFIMSIALCMQIFFWHYTIDDAYISFRYARNLAFGNGLVWNANEERVEGYSNFLWTLIAVPLEMLGLNTVVIMKIIGGICGIASIVALYSLSRFFVIKPLFGLMSCCYLAIYPAFALWSVSGLETSFYILVSLIAVQM